MEISEKTRIQDDIVRGLLPNPHGRLLISPRVGKSRITVELIKRDRPNNILWVTPSVELAEKDIPQEFEKWGAENLIDRLTTVTWKSLHKVEGYYDWVILDEEQHATEANTLPFFSGQLKYNNIISMTGTGTQHMVKKDIYRKLNLKILHETGIDEAVDKEILADYKIRVVQVPMNSKDKTVPGGTKAKPFMTTEEGSYNYLDRMAKQAMFQRRKDLKFRLLKRMRAIKDSPTKDNVAHYLMENLQGKKLFFCASINQAEELCPCTYHSKTTDVDLKRFLQGEIDEICMVNAGGTGFTYEGIDHLVLVQSDSDKNGLTSQKIARSLLEQENYKANIWVICLMGTQDEKWVESAMQNFDKRKIEYVPFINIENGAVEL